jgi:hypothetical protein
VSALLLTFYLAQRNAVKLAKNFFGVKDIKEAQQWLDQVMQEESRNNTAQILGRVDHLERKFIEGERNDPSRNPPFLKSL